MENFQALTKKMDFTFGNLVISPSYIQAGAIILLLFFLVLTLANLRRHFLNWSIKGSMFGIFWGFVLALLLEGFLIIGGKTVLTEIIGWKNAPKPLVNVLDLGREKLVNVLGITSEIPSSYADSIITSDKVLDSFRKLDTKQTEQVRSIICNP